MTNTDDLRHLLDSASRHEGDEGIEAGTAWEQGRRRRTRKRMGASAVAGVLGLAVVGIVWQTGVLGGSGTPDQGLAATIPEESITFVFTEAGSGVDLAQVSADAVRVPEVSELVGTSWQLQEPLWESGLTVDDVIGSTATTELSVDQRQTWGVGIEGCGGVWAQKPLSLGPDGTFAEDDEFATTDIGCPQDVQTAEDFWMDALPSGGAIHLLDGPDVLLLSIPSRGADDLVGVIEEPTEEPSDGPTTEPSEEPTGEPTDESEAAPTEEPEAPPTQQPTGGEDPETDPGGPWTPAGELSRSAGGLGAGGPLFAPELRAGAHDGFDRIVLDLTGDQSETAQPGWVAAYQDEAVLDASGEPAQMAGESLLQVIVSGMAYPEPGDPVYDGGPLRMQTPELGVVVEAVRTLPFEGQLQVLVGMSGEPRPYRVLVLTDPMRVVIDVQR